MHLKIKDKNFRSKPGLYHRNSTNFFHMVEYQKEGEQACKREINCFKKKCIEL